MRPSGDTAAFEILAPAEPNVCNGRPMRRFHKRTVPNVKRYVLKHKTAYKIRKTEKISEADIVHGILICEFICQQKPIAFSYGIGQRFTDAREEAFLNTPLPVK